MGARSTRHASKTIVICLVVCATVTAPAGAANTWYAAPGGPASGPCSQPSPCSAQYALVGNPSLAAGDTVIMAGGDYTLSEGIGVAQPISIEGATSGPPTHLILFGGTYMAALVYDPLVTFSNPVHVTDISTTVSKANGKGIAVANTGPAPVVLDRVRGEASGSGGAGIELDQRAGSPTMVVRDSVFRTTGSGSTAVTLNGARDGTSSFDLRNVVADSRNPIGTTGISLHANASYGPVVDTCGTASATLQNVYARAAAGADFDLTAAGIPYPGCSATIASSHSNWRGSTVNLEGVVNSDSDQHDSDALFADAAGGDYHEIAGSPTIDAGLTDPLDGPLDFDNQSRVMGAAPDIGADEFQPPAGGAGAGSGGAQDTVAPFGTAISFSPSSFAGESGGASISKGVKGTTVSYKVSEQANVAFTVRRQVKGRKKGKKCVARRKRGRRCTTFKAVRGSFARLSTSGTNSFHFTGVVAGKRLKPGRYRMSGVPTDASGNAGSAFEGSFTILRR